MSHLKLLHKHQHLISTLVYIDCHLRAPNRPPCQYGIHQFSGTGCPSTGVLASTETYDRLFVLLSDPHHILLVLFSAWMTYSASRSGPGGTVVPCIFGICVRLGVSPTTTEDPLQEILFWRWPDCFQPRAEQAKSHTAGTFKTLIVCSSPLPRHLTPSTEPLAAATLLYCSAKVQILTTLAGQLSELQTASFTDQLHTNILHFSFHNGSRRSTHRRRPRYV